MPSLTQAQLDTIDAAAAGIRAVVTLAQPDPGGGGGSGGGGGDPPPPPPTDEFRVLLPSAHMHEQPPQAFPDGTPWVGADFVRQSKLAPREVPWLVPMADAANGVITPSLGGKDPTSAHVLHVLGNPTQLYSQIQYFDALNGGRSDPFNPEIGDDFSNIVDDMVRRPMPDGARGIALTSPYVTIIPHPVVTTNPRTPIAILIGHDGTVWELYVRNGRVVLTRNGKLPGAQHIAHVCVDQSDRAVLYACELGTKIGTNWAGGCVVRYDRIPASRGNATQDENADLYTRTVAIPNLQYPSQVRTDKAGNVIAIDAGSGNFVRLDKATGAITIAGNVQYAYAMSEIPDPASGLKPYVVSRDMKARPVDLAPLATGGQLVALANVMPASTLTVPYSIGADFWTASIDLLGDCGPVGNVRVSRVHTGGNTNTWQISDGGATVKGGQQIFLPSMQGWNTVGRLAQVKEPYGHYDWLGMIYGLGQGISFAGGYANVPLTVVAYNANLPAQYLGDYTATWAGIRAVRRWGFTTMVTAEGWSRFAGCSADEMAELAKSQGYGAFADFLVGGMISAIPRPTLRTYNDGLELLALGMHLLGNSQRHLIDGKAFIDGWVAWWKTQYPGVVIPTKFTTVTASMIPDVAGGYLEARQPTPNSWRMGLFGIASAPTRYKSGAAGMEITATPIPADAMIVASYVNPATNQVTSTTKLTGLPAGEYAASVRSSSMPTRAIAFRVAA